MWTCLYMFISCIAISAQAEILASAAAPAMAWGMPDRANRLTPSPAGPGSRAVRSERLFWRGRRRCRLGRTTATST